MREQHRKWLIWLVILLASGTLGASFWRHLRGTGRDNGLASGNGRIEAVEIDIATKAAGRVKDILVQEGEMVTAGQVVALMDSEIIEAQRSQAEAQLRQAQSAVTTAASQLQQRESEKRAASALVEQRRIELEKARQHCDRSASLSTQGAISQQQADDDRAALQSGESAVSSAQAQVAAATAAIATAHAQIAGAKAEVEAVRATIARIEAEIRDCSLKASRAGRVQYRVAQPGEVLGGGGRVLSLLDLSDVYMTFFLPTAAAGKVAFGTEARLVLDAAPQLVIPATVSFISDEAQFTPKTVETANEREKLMFRVRAQIPVELLNKHTNQVKTGLPGVAYVRLDSNQPWPEHLQVNLPQ